MGNTRNILKYSPFCQDHSEDHHIQFEQDAVKVPNGPHFVEEREN